jgi:hypothetical protein
MSVISTGAHPKALWPGVHKFCMGVYDEFPEEFSKVFDIEDSTKAYEEDVETKEIVHWNIFNRATSGSYLGGDGVALLSTSHPTLSGNQSNKLATDADLSEASLEDLLTMIRVAKNSKAHPIMLKAKDLVVSPYDAWNAKRILNSTLQNDTANNAINAVKGVLDGIVVGTYLTDSDAWFVTTNAPAGLTSFKRAGYTFTTDNDFDTDNAKAKGYERYVPGWTDWRGVYGTSGL